MKLLHRLVLILLGIVVLVPTGALYLVASTESGLRFVATRLSKIGQMTVTVEGVSGTLTDGFSVESLRVQQRRADVRITNAKGQLRLMPLLLQRRIELSSATVEHVTIETLHSDKELGRAPRFMPATMRLDAETVRADSVDLILLNGQTLHGTGFSARVTILSDLIRVRDGQVDWSDMHLTADGRVHAAQPVGLDGKVVADWKPADRPEWKFAAEFDGDLDRLPFQADIDAPFHAHVDGAGATLNAGWNFAGEGETRDLDISVFGGGTALGIISTKLALTLDRNGFTATGPVTAPGLKAGPVQMDMRGKYTNHQLTIQNSTLVHRASGTRATVRGTVDVEPGGPRLALSGGWSTLQWPLVADTPAFTSTAGQYSIEGVKPWKVRAIGDVSAAGLTGLPASMEGTLGTDSLTIEGGTLGIYGGTAELTGQARWQPEESWAVAGHMNGMNPALLRADLPGRVDFDFRASGAPFGSAGSIDFSLARLSGKVRDLTASGSGMFSKPADSQDWRFSDVDLMWGRTHIQLDGSLGVPRDIRFALDADDLSLLDRDARGRISARGRYAGTDDAPVLLFKARGADFEWQGYQADAFEADIDIDLQGEGHAQGKVDLTGIHYGSRTAQHATIGITGTGTTQRVNLDVNLAPYRAVLTAEGAIEDHRWRGDVQSLNVTDGIDLDLHLERAAPVELDSTGFALNDLCLAGRQVRSCMNAQRTADGNWDSRFSVQAMPLRAFTAGLPQDMDYEGTINLQGELAGSPGGLPIGSLSAELMQAELLHVVGSGRIESLSLGTGTMQATATTDSFQARVALDGGISGDITGRLEGERNAGSWEDYPIRGQLSAHADALPLLDIYVGGIDRASGQLSTQVDISGTLGNPQWTGNLELTDASIDIYQVGLALRDLTLKARVDGKTLDLSGQSRLGEGMASFTGKGSWLDDGFHGTLHVGGKDLRVVNVPEARIDASPNLDFKLAGHHIDATGEVVVPKARLEPADLTNAVLASDDEHLVGEPPVDPEQRWIVNSRIKMTLGDDVRINSLGLTARLGGAITVITDESPVTRAQGELNIKQTEGKERSTYRAYGRLLDIERGRLIFNNGPINNPGVELRAQKEFASEFSTVTAGVNVRGQLRAPQVTFFSDPEMPQAQIASMIVAGGTLETAQNSDKPGAARNDLLMQGYALIGQRFGNRVGIDDVGVESGINNETSLVLGKYLSPRLYISYGISLAEAINTFKMRLALGKGWTIKSEAGQARSADLVYTFKKGAKKKSGEDSGK